MECRYLLRLSKARLDRLCRAAERGESVEGDLRDGERRLSVAAPSQCAVRARPPPSRRALAGGLSTRNQLHAQWSWPPLGSTLQHLSHDRSRSALAPGLRDDARETRGSIGLARFGSHRLPTRRGERDHERLEALADGRRWKDVAPDALVATSLACRPRSRARQCCRPDP